jgi:hypothetical protein
LTKLYIDSKQYDKAEEQLTILKSLPGASANTAHVGLYQKCRLPFHLDKGNLKMQASYGLPVWKLDRLNKIKKNAENKSDVGQLLATGST